MKTDTLEKAVALAEKDPEFSFKARGWTGSITILEDGSGQTIAFADGAPAAPVNAVEPAPIVADADHVFWSADPGTWAKLLAEVPPPRYTDPWGAATDGLTFEGGPFNAARHAALRRFCELMRHAENGTDPTPQVIPSKGRHGQHEAAVGRYVYLEIDGLEYRVYYERAGSGIPLLCQHTAGADGRQWRHFLEDPRITADFDVIVYDLPYHGKSLPPEGKAWWAEEYKLTLDFMLKFPTALSEALELDRPAFIGSSIGGMLALDLARYQPERYRAAISVQGGLKVKERNTARQTKVVADVYAQQSPGLFAEMINIFMAPTAPESARRETQLHYAQSAPGVFLGDTNYFRYAHDLTGEGGNIDTSQCMVYLLTGDYDYGSVQYAEEAAREIPGSDYRPMPGLGHYPMSEDHETFARHVIPVLESIKSASS